MGNNRSNVTDKFGHIQDLIVDLVFEKWNEARILELRSIIMSGKVRDQGADQAALVQRVVATLQVLADLADGLELESNPEKAARTMKQLTDKHQKLLDQIQSWFVF